MKNAKQKADSRKQFNYVVSFYMVVDVHMQRYHNNRVLQNFHCHMVVMENHMNRNDKCYFKKQRKVTHN